MLVEIPSYHRFIISLKHTPQNSMNFGDPSKYHKKIISTIY